MINELVADRIYTGQKLIIPEEVVSYRIRSGDTIGSIANLFGTKAEYIILINNIESESLTAGQTLRIPVLNKAKSAATVVQPEIVTAPKPQAASSDIVTYSVRSGDTLSAISRQFDVHVSQIKEWNRLTSDKILVGQKLTIYKEVRTIAEPEVRVMPETIYQPAIEPIAEPIDESAFDPDLEAKYRSQYSSEREEVVYTVRSGDTLNSIAQKFNVYPKEIMRWNGKLNNIIYIDEVLKINIMKLPTKEVSEPQRFLYTVKSGDTLATIAARFNVPISDLKLWNSKVTDVIYVGERLTVFPAKGKMPADAVVKVNPKDDPIQSKISTGSEPDITAPGASCDTKGGFYSVFPVNINTIGDILQTDRGVYLKLAKAANVVSVDDGVVEYTGKIKTYENVVIVRYSQNRRVIYGHLYEISVKMNQTVSKYQKLGEAVPAQQAGVKDLYLEFREGKEPVCVFNLYPQLSEKKNIVKK